jgi:hypothetical protein
MILDLQNVSVSFRTRLADVWKDLTLVVKNFSEVSHEDIDQYQILVLKNMVDDKYGDSDRFQ